MSYPYKPIKPETGEIMLQVSDSTMGLVNSCMRKLEFRKFLGAGRGEETTATGGGNAMHAGIQSYLVHGDFDRAVVDMAMKYPLQFYHDNVTANSDRSLEVYYGMFEKFLDEFDFNRYTLVNIKTASGEVKPAVELYFRINIKDFFLDDAQTIPVSYVGYIDLVLFDKFYNRTSVWDIKTSSNKMIDKTPLYRFSKQLTPYAFILMHLLQEQKIETFEANYLVGQVDMLNPSWKTYSFNRTVDDVRDWMHGLLLDLTRVRYSFKSGYFPRSGNCVTFSKPCEFFDWCHKRTPEALKRIIDLDKLQNKNKNDREVEAPWIDVDLYIQKEF